MAKEQPKKKNLLPEGAGHQRYRPTASRWPGDAPDIAVETLPIVGTAEVVVVGGGHAGLNCALAAAQEGASVIVVEMRREEHMRWIGEQIGSVNSKFLTSLGFGGYDEDEIVEEFCKLGHYYVNRVLVEKFVKNSGEMLDNLLSLLPEGSTVLDPDQCNVHQAAPGTKYPMVRGGYKFWASTLQFRGSVVETRDIDYTVNSFSRLPEITRAAMSESMRLGADWRFGHSGVIVTKDDAGRVNGVVAKNQAGELVRFIATKGVALTCGNFVETGHKMGVWAGGHMDNCPYERVNRMGGIGSRALGNASFLALNCHGKRFCNESVPYGNAASRQPTGAISWITDSKWLEQVKTSCLYHGNADFGVPRYFEQVAEDMSHVVDAGAEGYGVRNLALSEREQSVIYGANTLEELADYLGYEGRDKSNWLESIARYNELCYKGHDDDFGKDADTLLPIDEGPFYGGLNRVMPSNWSADAGYCGEQAGLATDDDMCVVDENCEPIPGLYAAGNNLGYIHSVFYCTPFAGNAIGYSATTGRVLGKYLARKA